MARKQFEYCPDGDRRQDSAINRLPCLALACLTLALAAPAMAAGAQPSHPAPLRDRSAWMAPGQTTSDDVRRLPQPADYNAPKGSFVLVGGRLFDATGAPARPATVVVTGKTIVGVLAPGDRNWPADARVYDITGKTVMPGLIDLHTHLTYVDPKAPLLYLDETDATLRGFQRMRTFAESGISSVRDVSSNGTIAFTLKAWQADGRIAGPRIFAAGQIITGRGGHGAEGVRPTAPSNPLSSIYEASGPDGWRDAVRTQFKAGADLIKLSSHYTQAEIDAAVDEAHMLGIPVTVDAETTYIDMAVAAGADSIEHPLPRSDATIARMVKDGVASVPTLVSYEILLEHRKGYFGSTSRRFELTPASTRAMMAKLRKAGVKMGVGTDLVSDWSGYMPDPYIRELRNLVSIGFTVPQALVAATKDSAGIMHMGDRLGTIQTGKLADILVVDGRPDETLEDLRKVDLLFVNGRLTVEQGQLRFEARQRVPMPGALGQQMP